MKLCIFCSISFRQCKNTTQNNGQNICPNPLKFRQDAAGCVDWQRSCNNSCHPATITWGKVNKCVVLHSWKNPKKKITEAKCPSNNLTHGVCKGLVLFGDKLFSKKLHMRSSLFGCFKLSRIMKGNPCRNSGALKRPNKRVVSKMCFKQTNKTSGAPKTSQLNIHHPPYIFLHFTETVRRTVMTYDLYSIGISLFTLYFSGANMLFHG